MIKSVMVRYNEDTGKCVVTEPCDTIAQVYSTKEEIHLPREPRRIEFTNPLAMSVYDSKDPISDARSKGYDKGFELGRNEMWNIVCDLMTNPDFGADFVEFGGWNSPVDIFKDNYERVIDIVQRWRGRPKRFDIVKVRFANGEEEAVITRVDGYEVNLMRRGGKTTRRNISDITNTGKALEFGLRKWVKGE